jgi:hypothetical protein
MRQHVRRERNLIAFCFQAGLSEIHFSPNPVDGLQSMLLKKDMIAPTTIEKKFLKGFFLLNLKEYDYLLYLFHIGYGYPLVKELLSRTLN